VVPIEVTNVVKCGVQSGRARFQTLVCPTLEPIGSTRRPPARATRETRRWALAQVKGVLLQRSFPSETGKGWGRMVTAKVGDGWDIFKGPRDS
jgi:hypothetical protein